MKYSPRWPLNNGHFNTVFTYLFRKVPKANYERERIELKDGDFLDLDWLFSNSKNLVIFSHGLEGSSSSKYILSMSDFFKKQKIDSMAWNCRGCSGEVNRHLKYYNSGVSDDLSEVIDHILETKSYKNIFLIGFSMGGNISLKYAGEKKDRIDSKIKGVMAISTPVHLASCGESLEKGFSRVYAKNFLETLKEKVILKKELMIKSGINIDNLKKIKTLKAFDDQFTAPLGGYKDAEDYYKRASSLYFLENIQIPSLIFSAKDDPFLTEDSFPFEEAQKNDFLDLEVLDYGGHVGFYETNGPLVTEKRALKFILDILR